MRKPLFHDRTSKSLAKPAKHPKNVLAQGRWQLRHNREFRLSPARSGERRNPHQ